VDCAARRASATSGSASWVPSRKSWIICVFCRISSRSRSSSAANR